MQRPLAVSRVMQVFRDESVRARLLWEEESAPYLQRRHCRTASTGFAMASECQPCEGRTPPEKIFVKIQEGLEHA